MKIRKSAIKELLELLGFKPQEEEKNIYYKNYSSHNNYVLKIDFEKEKIDYGTKIELGDLTTSNFENSENFVVLEGVDRVLEKGYAPNKLSLEHKWPMGRKEKGKLDILVKDKDDKAYLMIECKTWGDEYEKEKKKMQRDGGQLFSYFQQDKAAQYLCLYASRVNNGAIEYVSDIIKVDEVWRELDNQKEIFDHWNKNFKDNGIFEVWANAYGIEIRSLTRGRLKELTEEDSGRIYNQFAEILRHNVVSDKPNAFNKIFNLFLCKIVDEDRNDDDELDFQWKDNDTTESLQNRLNDLYKRGMKEYLTKDVTDYNEKDVNDKLIRLEERNREQILKIFSDLRLRKNPEFAFKEVFDEKSFEENAVVVCEVVELLQPYQIRYGHKQQFLGDFFELLLSTGIKQEAGQFFTPVPIAKFIISSLPLHELIEQKIKKKENNFLPYIIDYAAGSGHFLTESMDEVQNIIDQIDETKQRPSVKRNLSSWKINPFDWAYDYVYGIEADYRLVKTAKVSCFLNGDGLANVIHANGLDHFQKSTDYKGKLKELSKDNPKDNGGFDVLVANPPYSVSAFKNTLKNGEESFDLFNRLTDDSSEIECLFIERTKQLLNPGGWAGIILPSSILSNSGIYTDAREIILKYFNIKAIAEFGSNTFMATGTNTVTLFLERKANNDWKKIDSAIKNFFDKPREATVNGIEKAFAKYVEEVFEDISLQDYISWVIKKPNEAISNTELFTDYQTWFNSLTEIKNVKKKQIFKKKTKEQQQAELDKLFYDKVFTKEQDKMLYFFLAQPQQTLLIKVGEKQAEKDFIGYEFSSRRGHEGIKMYRDENGKPTTKLYDDDNRLNEEKANSYVYRAFLGEQKEIDESLRNNLTTFDLTELIDFKKMNFEKAISLGVKKKVEIKSKWNLAKLKEICDVKIGGTPSRNETQYFMKGNNLWVSISEMNGNIITDTKEKITDEGVSRSNVKLIKQGTTLVSFKLSIGKTAIAGKDLYTNEAIAALVLKDENKVLNKYLFSIFNARYIDLDKDTMNAFGKSLNSTLLKEVKIPLPPKAVQEKIISEIEAVEQKEKAGKEKVESLRGEISSFFANQQNFPNNRLENLCDIKSGGTPETSVLKYWQGGNIPWLKSEVCKDEIIYDAQTYITEEGLFKSSAKMLEKKSTLIALVGATKGKTAFISFKASTNQNIAGLFPKNLNKLNPKYLFYSCKGLYHKFVELGTYKMANLGFVKSLSIPVPSISEQQKIVGEINKLETEITQIEEELATMDEQKEQILKKHLE